MQSTLEVITPAASLDLTILANVKEQLGIAGSAFDTRLQNWIKQASDAISSRCDRVFAKETVKQTVFLDRPMRDIVLDRYPVQSVTTVHGDGVLVAAADYAYDKQKALLLPVSSGTLSNWCSSKIQIVYIGGYELLPELPYDLERACITLVSHLYYNTSRDPMMKRIEVPGVDTIDYWVGGLNKEGKLPPDVEMLIAPYVSYRF
jgi:uncharacterized phiE125 gp8 family phage protein